MRLKIEFILAALAITLSPLAPLAGETKVSKNVLQEPFLVAGFLVRTNNTVEGSGLGKIGPLWQRFYKDNLGGRIPDRADSALTVVYSDYASDEKGDYDYLLGARVTSVDHLPAGMNWKKVQPGTYAVFPTEAGQIPGVLQAAWRRIWQMPVGTMGGKRAFLTDYEIYDARSANPERAQVEIHIGLAPDSN
jgi:predicted transcriptional regulator YdeE